MKSEYAFIALSAGLIVSEPMHSSAQTVTLTGPNTETGVFSGVGSAAVATIPTTLSLSLSGDVIGTMSLSGSSTTVSTRVQPSRGYLSIGLIAPYNLGLQLGQIGSLATVQARNVTGGAASLYLSSTGTGSVFAASSSTGILGGFVTNSVTSSANYLTIAPSAASGFPQIIANAAPSGSAKRLCFEHAYGGRC